MINFIIPVRHQESVKDWEIVRKNLAITVRSVAQQQGGAWRAVVVANVGADLPDMPEGVEIEYVNMPYKPLPSRSDGLEAYYNAVRDDKGARVLAGIKRLAPQGYVMVVDYDDLVSSRLASLCASYPDEPGWFIDKGYFFSGGSLCHVCQRDFFEICGTSLIVQSGLLAPEPERLSLEDVRYRLGSHKFVKRSLDENRTPLQPLPFAGAAYRVGHLGQTSGAKGLVSYVLWRKRLLARPDKLIGRILGFRINRLLLSADV